MYFARFELGERRLLTAALGWRPEGALIMPLAWRSALLEPSRVDVALRVRVTASGAEPLLLLNADAAGEGALAALCERLLQAAKPADLQVAGGAAAFDRMAASLPAHHLRVNHRGFRHDGLPLACDFRLHPLIAGAAALYPVVYQVHLRAHRPDKETERRVLKYLAWLDVEAPFSDSVRAMQRLLATRLLRRGFRVGEFLAAESDAALAAWGDRIGSFFLETTGRIGFGQAPVEVGDFADLLAVGCHPESLEDEPELPERAATVFEEPEVAELLASEFVRAGAAPGRGSAPDGARVFISYSSNDFASAAAVCHALEQDGLACWMAPRDVNSGPLPYTEAIQRGIAQSRAVVVILSEAANLSAHIPRELDLALERRLAIIPVRVCEVAPAGQLNYLLRTCQWLNAFGRDFSESMGELLGRLRG